MTAGALLAATAIVMASASQDAPAPALTIDAARVSIAGTSNIHPYTASTTTVRVTRLQLASAAAGGDVWQDALKPGAIEGLEIAIPAATLSSPREGLDKNMHRALKVAEHADITFRLLRLEGALSATSKAVGLLRVAGVEREVVLDTHFEPRGSTLVVTGETRLLMTDFGIAPPKAMLGMLKTDPKVTVTFEVILAASAGVRTVAE